MTSIKYNIIPPFLARRIYPETTRAAERFSKMLENLIETRREEICQGKRSHIPDNEKDLLTLMIEEDNEVNTEVSLLELRVRVYYKHKY